MENVNDVGELCMWLARIEPKALCDICLSELTGVPVGDVRPAADQLVSLPEFERLVARCANCRSTKRTTTRMRRMVANG